MSENNSHMIHIDGRKLHVHQFGEHASTPLVGLHGLTGHGQRFENIHSLLENETGEKFRMLAPDLLGHGRSCSNPPWGIDHQADIIGQYIQSLGTPVGLVGHSYGAGIGLHIASQFPDAVKWLLLLDPSSEINPRLSRVLANAAATRVGFDSVAEAIADKKATGWHNVSDAVLDNEIAHHLIPAGEGRFRWRVSTAAVVTSWSELTRPACTDITVPTHALFATGDDFPYLGDRAKGKLEERGRGLFTSEEIECSHSIAEEQPESVVAAIISMLHR